MSFAREVAHLRGVLTGAVREALRAAPALWSEHRKRKKAQRRAAELPPQVFLVLLALGALSSKHPAAALLLGWTLIATAAVFGHASGLRGRVAQEAGRLAALPVPHAALFDLERARAAGGRWRWLVTFLAAAAVGAAATRAPGERWPDPAHVAAWLGIAAVQALSIHAFALHLLAWRPERAFSQETCCCSLLIVGLLGLAMVPGDLPARGIELLAAHPWGLLLSPLGWAPYGALALADGRWLEGLTLLPALALIASAAGAGRRAAAGLRWAAIVLEDEEDELGAAPGEGAQQGADASVTEPPDPDLPFSPAAAEAVVRAGTWLTGGDADERRGWLERAALAVLTPRERLVYELLQPAPAWTQRWKLGLGAFVLLLAIAAAIPRLQGVAAFALLGPFAVLPFPGEGSWPGVGAVWASGGSSPRWTYFPAAYADLRRVLLKVNALRALTFLLPAATLGGLALPLLGAKLTLEQGWLLGARLTVIYLLTLPTLSALQVDQALSGDGIKLRELPGMLLWLVLVVGGSLLLFFQPSASLRMGVSGPEFVPESAWAALGAGVVALAGSSVWWLHPWLRRRRDLVSDRPPDTPGL
ncbi:MAG: hypothetical protein AB7N76_23140 [Planctomycetota bacterium]